MHPELFFKHKPHLEQSSTACVLKEHAWSPYMVSKTDWLSRSKLAELFKNNETSWNSYYQYQ